METRSNVVVGIISLEIRYKPAPRVKKAIIPTGNPMIANRSTMVDVSSELTPASLARSHEAAKIPPRIRIRKFHETRV